MTDDRILTPDKQARAEMTARPYQSKTRTFIRTGEKNLEEALHQVKV